MERWSRSMHGYVTEDSFSRECYVLLEMQRTSHHFTHSSLFTKPLVLAFLSTTTVSLKIMCCINQPDSKLDITNSSHVCLLFYFIRMWLRETHGRIVQHCRGNEHLWRRTFLQIRINVCSSHKNLLNYISIRGR
jgi:hypothetical protein